MSSNPRGGNRNPEGGWEPGPNRNDKRDLPPMPLFPKFPCPAKDKTNGNGNDPGFPATVTEKKTTNDMAAGDKAVEKFPKYCVLKGDPLGQGGFGSVVKASVNHRNVRKDVVVKMIHNPIGQRRYAIFLHTCKRMFNLQHRNLVKFIGMVDTAPNDCPQFIFQAVSYGSLLNFVKKNDVGPELLNKLTMDIVHGMEYLHNRVSFIHGCLGARNVLLNESRGYMNAKISDYGMSRIVTGAGANYFSHTSERSIPIRWLPKESMPAEPQRTIGKPADVWSFGVLLWEMWSKGDVPYGPYGTVSNLEVQQLILSGSSPLAFRQPECEQSVMVMMRNIFVIDSLHRPTFGVLKLMLETPTGFRKMDKDNVSTSLQNSVSVPPTNPARRRGRRGGRGRKRVGECRPAADSVKHEDHKTEESNYVREALQAKREEFRASIRRPKQQEERKHNENLPGGHHEKLHNVRQGVPRHANYDRPKYERGLDLRHSGRGEKLFNKLPGTSAARYNDNGLSSGVKPPYKQPSPLLAQESSNYHAGAPHFSRSSKAQSYEPPPPYEEVEAVTSEDLHKTVENLQTKIKAIKLQTEQFVAKKADEKINSLRNETDPALALQFAAEKKYERELEESRQREKKLEEEKQALVLAEERRRQERALDEFKLRRIKEEQDAQRLKEEEIDFLAARRQQERERALDERRRLQDEQNAERLKEKEIDFIEAQRLQETLDFVKRQKAAKLAAVEANEKRKREQQQQQQQLSKSDLEREHLDFLHTPRDTATSFVNRRPEPQNGDQLFTMGQPGNISNVHRPSSSERAFPIHHHRTSPPTPKPKPQIPMTQTHSQPKKEDNNCSVM